MGELIILINLFRINSANVPEFIEFTTTGLLPEAFLIDHFA